MRAIPLDADSPRLAQWQWHIEQIKRMGFTGTYVSDGPLPQRGQRVQVRDLKKDQPVAPPLEVSRYAESYRQGDQIPPIIVTADRVTVDGNTRSEAALRAGLRTIPQFRLNVEFENATPDQMRRLIELGTAMNGMNGRGLSLHNVEQVVSAIYTEGEDAKALAARIHYPVATVKRVFTIQEGRRWLARLGVADEDQMLSAGHFQLIGGWKQKMTDPVLANLVTLVRDARMTIAETGNLGQQVMNLTTEVAKLDHIEAERHSNADRIHGNSGRPSISGQFRQALGHVRRFAGNPGAAAELDPRLQDRHIAELKEAQYIISQVLKEQYANQLTSGQRDISGR